MIVSFTINIIGNSHVLKRMQRLPYWKSLHGDVWRIKKRDFFAYLDY